MSHASVAYICAATNRHSCAATVSSSGLVAFGSANYVALWNTEDEADRGVLETLPAHEGIVTSVHFRDTHCLFSGDDKGWRVKHTTNAHSRSISTLTVQGNMVLSGASDCNVKIWNANSGIMMLYVVLSIILTAQTLDSLVEVQTISLRNRYPLSIAVSDLPLSQASILAIGTTDRNIQIWTRSEESFVYSATLSGHEDWVKCLAFCPRTGDEALVLASGSQDGTIRLWNIELYTKHKASQDSATEGELSDELLDAFEASLGDLADAEEGGRQISLKRHILTVKANSNAMQQFSITFDALLIGHEAGVTSLSWRPSKFTESTLLSTSTDSSVILWSPSTVLGSSSDKSSSLWINRQRFGDIGGQRLGGFVGGIWTNKGMDVLAWGWNGGWRRWRCIASIGADKAAGPEEWSEIGAITGHCNAVKGLSWSPRGEYLLSTGLDQTTRIHAPIDMNRAGCNPSWHEISRPQVHGYDLIDVAFLEPTRFVSIADEKVARVFEAPKEFIDLVTNLRIADIRVDKERPRAATVPPLGLSNKAVEASQNAEQLNATDPSRTKRRPFEGELAATTLWPETEKVFGHGYESISLAVSNHRRYAATACKATSPEHAVVRVYDTTRWKPFGPPLAGHTLTVTRIAFSPDDRYILSVSRDRSWHLFELAETGDGYVPCASDKSHGRIIWDCAWAPEGDIFATASRDKTVKIWHIKERGLKKWTAEATIKLQDAATAVSFAPADADHRRRLAIGLESGMIHVYSSDLVAPSDWRQDFVATNTLAHTDHVNRLAWRPGRDGITKELASCSEDGTLKVLLVHVK
ncbi:WD40 repeat-like protein [Panus rudis PR-1116 ss-1]|nr:WD40 repeat-like protein [Panus rudis PR-1116 ss-1]